MIVKSRFRQAGGIEAHLLRNDTNERVEVRRDLFRGPPDLNLCLRLMDGISRSNEKTKRAFIHVIISPNRELDSVGLDATLAMIEGEFGIASDSPRAIVQHVKGNRPDHYHAVYSIVDLQTGRAIPSHGNFETDELISRRLEIRLNEPIVPGPRLADNVAELRRRGLDDEASILEPCVGTTCSGSLSRKDRQQATRLGIDPGAFSANVYALFEKANRDFLSFGRLLDAAGYAVCKGQSAILVMDDETGFQTSLVRCLRREAKAAGRPAQLKESDLAKIFGAAKPKTEERDAGFARAQWKATRALDHEVGRAMFEAVADSDLSELENYRALQKQRRKQEAEEEQDRFRQTLQARRTEILQIYRQRDEVRRARVDRAFRMARLVETPVMRRLAFVLATMGVLMTGASLTLALMGGSIAIAALPSIQRARKLAASSTLESARTRQSRRDALVEAYEKTKDEFALSIKRAQFSFDEVPKPARILAGFYAVSWLGAGGVEQQLSATAKKAGEALGVDIVRGLKAMLDRGSTFQIQRLTSWYTSVAEKQRLTAVGAALKRYQAERAVADAASSPQCETQALPGRHSGNRRKAKIKMRPEADGRLLKDISSTKSPCPQRKTTARKKVSPER